MCTKVRFIRLGTQRLMVTKDANSHKLRRGQAWYKHTDSKS